jgi:hypothetical protein
MPWRREHRKDRFIGGVFATVLVLSATLTATAVWGFNYTAYGLARLSR